MQKGVSEACSSICKDNAEIVKREPRAAAMCVAPGASAKMIPSSSSALVASVVTALVFRRLHDEQPLRF